MNQRDTLVARAIVACEIGELERASSSYDALPLLTVDRIVAKYGLSWGRFSGGNFSYATSFKGANRARQLIRNELNRAFRDGRVCKLRDQASFKKVREGRCVCFVSRKVPWRHLNEHGVIGERGTADV